MNFFKTGEEGRKFFAEKEKAKAEASFSGGVRNDRFNIPKGSTGYIVFLDNLDFFMEEHQFTTTRPDGSPNYYNYETCIRDMEGECPLDDNGNRPATVSVSTIFDLTDRKSKDGKLVAPRKRLIVFKHGGTERFLRKQDKLGGLKYKKFEMYRSNDQKGEATGTDAEFEKDIDPEQLRQFCPEKENFDDWIKPFDYAEIFKPKSAAEIRRLIGISDPVGTAESQEEPAKQSLKDML